MVWLNVLLQTMGGESLETIHKHLTSPKPKIRKNKKKHRAVHVVVVMTVILFHKTVDTEVSKWLLHSFWTHH